MRYEKHRILKFSYKFVTVISKILPNVQIARTFSGRFDWPLCKCILAE